MYQIQGETRSKAYLIMSVDTRIIGTSYSSTREVSFSTWMPFYFSAYLMVPFDMKASVSNTRMWQFPRWNKFTPCVHLDITRWTVYSHFTLTWIHGEGNSYYHTDVSFIQTYGWTVSRVLINGEANTQECVPDMIFRPVSYWMATVSYKTIKIKAETGMTKRNHGNPSFKYFDPHWEVTEHYKLIGV